MHRLKSKPLGVCCCAHCFAACCFRDAPIADTKVLKSKALRRCLLLLSAALKYLARRASGCGREVANRRRGTAATEPKRRGMAKRSRQRLTGRNPVPRARRASAPLALPRPAGLHNAPRCAPTL